MFEYLETEIFASELDGYYTQRASERKSAFAFVLEFERRDVT